VKIYVASSWRNSKQYEVVAHLRASGHVVYDFRSPAPGDRGFHWSEIDPNWKSWNAEAFRAGLGHPIARDGFEKDMAALRGCDICVLVQPCGRSAHLEFGYAVSAGKLTVALLADGSEPELMYRMCDVLVVNFDELDTALAREETNRLTLLK
jgi:hypothetical protein